MMKAAVTALLRVRHSNQAATQRLAFSTEATDAAAAALRMVICALSLWKAPCCRL